MINLVNDLLNVSRIETGRLKINREPVDVEKFLGEIIGQISSYGEAQNCKLILHPSSVPLPFIRVDQVFIRQVFHNLLVNAIEYYPSTEPHHIDVEVQKTSYNPPDSVEEAKEYVMVKVIDHGIGISKEIRPQIFSKFFRAENARKVKPDGTGLGLYISKSIVEMSGGHIWFETEEGKGTTFFVLLPVVIEEKIIPEIVV
jgi:signal transduction histidine kinase